MPGILQLTWRYLTFHKVKTVLLLIALTLTLFLPIAAAMLVRFYESDLNARAAATPLVAGKPGDRFDLVLKSLYFTGEAPPALRLGDFTAIADEGRGTAIPLYLEFSARGKPLVATTPEYYRFPRP